MSEYILDAEQANADQQISKPVARWNHGLLLPVKATYYKWASKAAEGQEKEKPAEVTREEFLGLEDAKRGEKFTFELDGKVLNPALQYAYSKWVYLGFPDWNEVVLPSIANVIGTGSKAWAEFVGRARSGLWYTEVEIVDFGKNTKTGVTNRTWAFRRMTQDLNELKAWNTEKYPKKDNSVPAEKIEEAKAYWKLARTNPDVFNTILSQDTTMNPYFMQLVEMSKGW